MSKGSYIWQIVYILISCKRFYLYDSYKDEGGYKFLLVAIFQKLLSKGADSAQFGGKKNLPKIYCMPVKRSRVSRKIIATNGHE